MPVNMLHPRSAIHRLAARHVHLPIHRLEHSSSPPLPRPRFHKRGLGHLHLLGVGILKMDGDDDGCRSLCRLRARHSGATTTVWHPRST